jgi:pseudouridine synthase
MGQRTNTENPPGSAKARPLKTLERVLSKAGLGSRTEARRWIHAGRVQVNGRRTENPDHWVDLQRDRVRFDGQPLRPKTRRYVLLNKPTGFITSYTDPQGRPTVYDLVEAVGTFLSSVGRLDRDTSGLLLLTNDNRLAEHVTNPASHVAKTYVATLSRPVADDELERLRAGLDLSDGPTRPADVRRLPDADGRPRVELTLTEGRNRQVRRMIEAVGARVVELSRVRIGSIELGALPLGAWRDLTSDEVASLAPVRRRA